ncbi:FAD-dependent oxidoreductase [Streptomyces sp. NPDC017890]|uniref:FAD-dependent oxidoreductase n=1 Tax=Streptomyces sp. NPDC017890 TaxID=3365015 RepID=UPI0037A0F826
MPRTQQQRLDHRARLSRAAPTAYWLDRPDGPPAEPRLTQDTSCDLAVVGGGYTGLWTALLTKRRHPRLDVLLVEKKTCGHAASGRNGGFCSPSLTHGLANGAERWPDDIGLLQRLGTQNFNAFQDDLATHGIDCGFTRSGKITVAATPWQADAARSIQLTTSHLGALNEFCWMDLKTHDVPGTAAFFSTVLGWRFAVDEDDWRRATKIFAAGHQIGSVSDLSAPVYPPGTPAHIAYYLAVDDIDARTEAATAAGAQLVLAPFDAGDQGRIATLIDPVGAVFSLWQTQPFNRWLPTASALQRMILACPSPEQARRFYQAMLGTVPGCADFVLASGAEGCVPRWELVVGVEDPNAAATRARGLGQEVSYGPDRTAPGGQRLSSPDGLTFRIRAGTA